MRSSRSLLTRLARGAMVSVLAAATGLLAVAAPAQAATFTQVTSFGSNPGNLTMYAYRPDNLPTGAPAVVLLHGCAQNASTYHSNSGWKKYSDQWKFTLIYAEQKSGNNSSSCFNWFETGDTARGQGEALSIEQMTDYARNNYGTASNRIYVSGLSAGGAMSSTMLATYPDVFAGGSVVAGIPYRCATSMTSAFSCMSPGVNKSPAQWGDLVRNAYPGYSGPRPKVAIWHGTSDYTVAVANATESRDQWTNVAGVSQSPTGTQSLPGGTTLEKYGSDVVRVYRVSGMGHGTPVDPGGNADQCGTAGAYFLDTICAAYHEARYFGLDGSGGGDPGNPGAPAAPTGLRVTGTTTSSVSLSWSSASGATGYHVYRDGSRVTSSAISGTSYTNSGLASATTYSFAVSAVNSAGEGAKSATVSATTGGTAPVCVTSNNYQHVQAGRAYHSGGYAYARGSNQRMGLYNIFNTTTLKQTGANYWVIGC